MANTQQNQGQGNVTGPIVKPVVVSTDNIKVINNALVKYAKDEVIGSLNRNGIYTLTTIDSTQLLNKLTALSNVKPAKYWAVVGGINIDNTSLSNNDKVNILSILGITLPSSVSNNDPNNPSTFGVFDTVKEWGKKAWDLIQPTNPPIQPPSSTTIKSAISPGNLLLIFVVIISGIIGLAWWGSKHRVQTT